MKEKKGQIQISFGMIFSIIVIIATVAVAFYVITFFLNMNSCNKIASYWVTLNSEVDKMWNSDGGQKLLTLELPSRIDKVCFGNFTQMPTPEDKAVFLEIETYGRSGRNAYLYPPGSACDNAFYGLKHAATDKFFCVPVKSGKASVRVSKTSSEALAKLSKP